MHLAAVAVRVSINMVDPAGVKGAGPADQAVNFISFL
jgi:hypothetical protein